MQDRTDSRSADPPAAEPQTTVQVDWRAVVEDLGGDESLLRELIDVFLTSYPEMLNEVRQGLEQGDMRRASRGSHKIAGTVGNFGFGPAYGAARTLEQSANASRTADAQCEFEAVQKEVQHLADIMQSYLRAGFA